MFFQKSPHVIPRICEYVTLQGKRVFADVIKVMDLKMKSSLWIIWVSSVYVHEALKVED